MNEKPVMYTMGDLCAVYKSTNNTTSFQHYHDSYEISFFINAKLQIFLRDINYEIKDGDLIFVNEYDIHKYIYDDCSTYNRYVINFKKDLVLPLILSSGVNNLLGLLGDLKYTKVSTSLKERAELEGLFKALVSACNPQMPVKKVSQVEVSGAAVLNAEDAVSQAKAKSYLLLILIRIYELLCSKKAYNFMNKKDILVQKIVKFIDANYISNITLEMLEKMFYMDKFHIVHNFKAVTGFTVMEYVQHRRVIEAQKMLKKVDKDIIDICFDCGFNNIQHFYRVFKKISGFTPAKFRKLEA